MRSLDSEGKQMTYQIIQVGIKRNILTILLGVSIQVCGFGQDNLQISKLIQSIDAENIFQT